MFASVAVGCSSIRLMNRYRASIIKSAVAGALLIVEHCGVRAFPCLSGCLRVWLLAGRAVMIVFCCLFHDAYSVSAWVTCSDYRCIRSVRFMRIVTTIIHH